MLELWDELLHDFHFEVVEDVGDGLVGDEDGAELVGEVAAVFFLLLLLRSNVVAFRRGRGRDELDAYGEVVCLDDVADGTLEAVDGVCANGEAADFDLGAHAIDAEDKVHGGLLVLVDEAEGAEACVPGGREARGEGLAFCERLALVEADEAEVEG